MEKKPDNVRPEIGTPLKPGEALIDALGRPDLQLVKAAYDEHSQRHGRDAIEGAGSTLARLVRERRHENELIGSDTTDDKLDSDRLQQRRNEQEALTLLRSGHRTDRLIAVCAVIGTVVAIVTLLAVLHVIG